jgi:hypothetical protein
MEAPYNGTTGIQTRPGIWGTSTSFEYTFPEASVTCLMIHPEGSGTHQENSGGLSMSVAPIPVLDSVEFTMGLNQTSSVLVRLFDCSGRLVKVIADEEFSPGIHQFQWERGAFPAGVYLIRVFSDEEPALNRKIVLI